MNWMNLYFAIFPERRLTPATAKVELKKRGHTYRSAAPYVGRTFPWICQVLNGRATSQPVLDAVYRLPRRELKGKRS